MAEIHFSNAAIADLAEIDEFSAARFGDEVADLYMRGFNAAFARLRDYPLVAPLWPEVGEDIRCLVFRQHRLFYQAAGDRVLILRILHHARDAKRVLRGAG